MKETHGGRSGGFPFRQRVTGHGAHFTDCMEPRCPKQDTPSLMYENQGPLPREPCRHHRHLGASLSPLSGGKAESQLVPRARLTLQSFLEHLLCPHQR